MRIEYVVIAETRKIRYDGMESNREGNIRVQVKLKGKLVALISRWGVETHTEEGRLGVK